MDKKYNVVVVGVGAVGEEMLKILAERQFPLKELKVLARSPRNVQIGGKNYSIRTAAPEEFEGADLVFFAGTEGAKGASVTFTPEVIKRGAVAIDNGSDFRMDPKVPLVIPEVNPEALSLQQGIIASPNCSTIQMLVALAPLYRESRIKRIIVSTYQAVSGSGRAAIRELEEQTPLSLAGRVDFECRAYPYPIAFNLIPQIGSFGELDYTTEEWKMDQETKKIFNDPDIMVAATTVRVPVFYAHSESIYIETETPLSVDEVRYILRSAPGVVVMDDPADEKYPLPITAAHRDEVFVGRIRKDPYVENGLHLWVVSDNIRKGAALNVIQIAEKMIVDGLL